MQIAIIIIISLIFIMGLLFISSYNKLAKTRSKVENSWGQINVQLKMRADLVPNIVETVKGYAKHEQETLTKVMEARNQFMSAKTPEDTMNSASQMKGIMGRLFAVAEEYPELKANQNYLNLQEQLGEIENKITMYRQFYNDTVMLYNRLIITFPKNIFASILGFEELPYFQIDDGERSAPKVNFN